ncbi:MAG: hypothetical protein JWN48_454 [Myxococcaceae bacterium]|nr:hypothetical protein [Myxococcaceae bacterium]
MKRGPRWLWLGLLWACDVARPDGSFMPVAEQHSEHGFGRADAEVPLETEGDASRPATEAPDGGQPPSVVSDPGNPLAVLQGSYLMRVEVYSTASASKLGNTLTLKSRVSNLMVAAVRLKSDGTLGAHETLCTQSYTHECVSNCSNWTTTVDPELPKHCVSRAVDRDYVVSASGALRVAPSVIAIGFDEQDGISALPTDPSDPRVWHMGAPDEERYGVNTHLTATLGSLATVPLSCYVGTVQRFSTAFSGQLDLTTFGADALVQKPMLADSGPSSAATIYVDGQPSDYCNKAQLDSASQQTPDEITVVRFKRYDGVECPTSQAAYDAVFPGDPRRPTQADLM